MQDRLYRSIAPGLDEGTAMNCSIFAFSRRNLIALVGALTLLGAVQAAPATAISGRVTVPTQSIVDSSPSRTTTAYCPAGKRVVGGGGGVNELTVAQHVVLTQMKPTWSSIGQDRFSVSAHEDQDGTNLVWSVRAWAICVDPIPGMNITAISGTAGSPSVLQYRRVCAPGEKVLGSGGWISDTGGEVGIQVSRASDLGDLAYFQGHEDADGYSRNWSQLAVAVCAPPPAGYEVVTAPSSETLSQNDKWAYAHCTGARSVLNAGAATAFNAPGNVFVSATYASLDDRVTGWAAENVPTMANWDFIVAQAICVN